jgi:hypothetical protein
MTHGKLTDALRRFIFSIPSVPHLEAMLLIRGTAMPWDAVQLARRLYLPEERAAGLLKDLRAAGICTAQPDQADDLLYRYQPASDELHHLIEALADYYSRNLIEVTNMIHAQSRRHMRIQQFADAFRWGKKS